MDTSFENVQAEARKLYRGWSSRPTSPHPDVLRSKLFAALLPNLVDATTPCKNCGAIPLFYHEGICPCSQPGWKGWEEEMMDGLLISEKHLWVRPDGGEMVIGITDYAQEEMGELVFVELPEVEAAISATDPFGTLESAKTVQDLIAPISGTVLKINEAAVKDPSVINDDPYHEGWLIRVQPDEDVDLSVLMDPKSYVYRESD